jgi:hypothetical protein
MRKWNGFFLSVFLILIVISISDSFRNFKLSIPKEADGEELRIILLQAAEKEGKKGEADPNFILILKQVKEKLDAWLKSLNERIESEDVTRFEVRFLEILRSILEWVKEKIDSKIASSEETKGEKKEKGLFKEPEEKKEGE